MSRCACGFFVASYDSNANWRIYLFIGINPFQVQPGRYDQLAITNIDTAYFSWTPSISDEYHATLLHDFFHDDHCGFTGKVSHQFSSWYTR
ncbi:MAG: hypothetical protein IPG90_04210 [Bacteroidetes bacterium]|nr:hypothetical protein [Bacteroidota bacterium]